MFCNNQCAISLYIALYNELRGYHKRKLSTWRFGITFRYIIKYSDYLNTKLRKVIDTGNRNNRNLFPVMLIWSSTPYVGQLQRQHYYFTWHFTWILRIWQSMIIVLLYTFFFLTFWFIINLPFLTKLISSPIYIKYFQNYGRFKHQLS